MKNRIGIVLFATAMLAAPVLAQSALPLPSPVEKELAARASDVTEVTLGKDMLGFAAKFMDKNDKDQAAVQQLINGLDGVYVRSYEFDKEGQYSMDEIGKLRESFGGPEWSPMVHTREHNGAETTDVLVKLVNGEPHGIFVLDAEPKELTIVLILGPIRMDQLSELQGLSGLGKLGDVDLGQKSKATKDNKGEKGDKGDKGEK
ncbi:MAG TPA: DUF4252 domain-containing protein [Terracidiphilus sp.]|nr:DUF4252 domain-containing protein [Terracidiphilus sp.]